jgi:urease subunit gamma/beta
MRSTAPVRLLPQEHDRLTLFLAAELARRRRARGLRLSQAEAVALIADETMELARDGLPYADVERRAYGLLGPEDVQETASPAWSSGSSSSRCLLTDRA